MSNFTDSTAHGWSLITEKQKDGMSYLLAYPNGVVKIGRWDDGPKYWSAGQWFHEAPPTHFMHIPSHPSSRQHRKV